MLLDSIFSTSNDYIDEEVFYEAIRQYIVSFFYLLKFFMERT